MRTIHEVDVSEGIECGGFHIAVVVDERAQRMIRANNNYGEADFQHYTLAIDPLLEPRQFSKTFIHEGIEHVNNIYLDNKMEHDMLQRLSFGLHQVMESLGVRFVVKKEEV